MPPLALNHSLSFTIPLFFFLFSRVHGIFIYVVEMNYWFIYVFSLNCWWTRKIIILQRQTSEPKCYRTSFSHFNKKPCNSFPFVGLSNRKFEITIWLFSQKFKQPENKNYRTEMIKLKNTLFTSWMDPRCCCSDLTRFFFFFFNRSFAFLT